MRGMKLGVVMVQWVGVEGGAWRSDAPPTVTAHSYPQPSLPLHTGVVKGKILEKCHIMF